MSETSKFNFFKPIHFDHCTKEEIKTYFNGIFEMYEELFSSIVNEETFYLCPDRLRLPLIFYYGHTAAVFINKLCLAGVIKPNERKNLEFETMFETGVDEMSWDSIEHYRMGGEMEWPTVGEVRNYREQCKSLINEVIDRNELVLPITMDSPWWVIFMGIEHENIHFETSSVLIRQYPVELVTKPAGWKYAITDNSRETNLINNMIQVTDKESLKVKLGKSRDFPNYGWDNEYGLVECELTPFEASEFKITNEQFLQFVLIGGYETPEYWSKEGWKWRSFKDAKHPKFWVCPKKCASTCGGALSECTHCSPDLFTESEVQKFDETLQSIASQDWNGSLKIDDFGYKCRLMYDVVSMPSNWPVEVNYHEAKAYCAWKGGDYRLLSEAEHHAIRDPINEAVFECDVNFYDSSKFNNRMIYGSSTAVNLYKPTEKGFYDVFGNVWEWIEDHFNALPGGTLDYLYADFSTPCYDGRHNLIMGGSWASCGNIASYFARYMFRRHFFQHCGFRMARSLPTDDRSKFNPQIRYVADSISVLGETEKAINKSDLDPAKYELKYYPSENAEYVYDSDLHTYVFENEAITEFKDEWFVPMMENIEKVLKQNKISRNTVVHFGTSLGRVSLELAKTFKEVYALDFSTKLLEIALRLQEQGEINIKLNNQEISYNIKDNDFASRVNFKQITWIPNEMPQSDFVLFTMLDRVGNHLSWLRRLKEIVKPEGVLVLYSKESKYNSRLLAEIVHEFQLKDEISVVPNDSLTVWKLKKDYVELSL